MTRSTDEVAFEPRSVDRDGAITIGSVSNSRNAGDICPVYLRKPATGIWFNGECEILNLTLQQSKGL